MIYFEEEKRKIAIKEKEMLYHTVLCLWFVWVPESSLSSRNQLIQEMLQSCSRLTVQGRRNGSLGMCELGEEPQPQRHGHVGVSVPSGLCDV